MGILQSVLQCLGFETDEEKSGISTMNSYNFYSHDPGRSPTRSYNFNSHDPGRSPTRSYNFNSHDPGRSPTRSYNFNSHDPGRSPTRSYNFNSHDPGRSPTRSNNFNSHDPVYVPDLRASSSYTYTTVNDKVKNSVGFTKENVPPNGCRGGGRRLRDEIPVVVKSLAAAPEGRWIKHYSSCHRILLVGEGDFSFSTCLASAFGRASNMVATSLDSRAFLVKNYGSASSNLVALRIRGCSVMHGINATEMANSVFLGGMKFDRIIFNFPFAGFFRELSRDAQLRRHRRLVSEFMENAKKMMSEKGEIHITHKTNGFLKEWKVEVVASSHGLRLLEALKFNRLDYPGYNTKYGFGGDRNFNCKPSITYKFAL